MRGGRIGLAEPQRREAIEWPTIGLALIVYGGWMLLTCWHARLPSWLLVAAGGWFVAWQSSLQHETIHGHPTRWHRLNAAIGAVPLSLWLPYRCYRRDHIAHHAAEMVTDPIDDPESRYLLAARGPAFTARRLVASLQAPLIGRLILGPIIVVTGFLAGEVRRARRDPAGTAHDWLPHLAGLAVVLAWLHVCRLDVGRYLLMFVYPGTALTLLRSFAEHRAAEAPDHRVAIVERAGPLALLFLHNNLHAAHHRAPGLAWYRLPAFYRRHRDAILRDNGGLLYRGYGEIARRFALRPHDAIVHPRFGHRTAG